MSYQLMSYQLIEFSVEAGVATIAFNRPERRNAMSDDVRAGAAPAISDLLGGQIDVMFTTVASAASLVAAGQLRALAVTSAERSAAFPQLPTVAEAGVPGYAAESWYGLYAPAKTPAPVIARLNQAVAKAVQSGAFKQLEANEGLIMVGSAPEQLDRYVGLEEDRWRKLVKDANIEVQ